jgi:hypothetical protein
MLEGYTHMGEWFGRRFWESRQFYSSYIALFIAISNWITIQYRLLLEHVPFLNYLFSNIVVFMIVATIVFTILSVLGGHYIHRKRQFRLEQAVAIEENPYLYKAAPGKERDLMLPVTILQMDTLEELLRTNGSLTEEKKRQFDAYRRSLVRLMEGQNIGTLWT